MILAVGCACGFYLLWRLGVDLQVLQAEGSVIQARINEGGGTPPWTVFCTYSPAYDRDKKLFWESIVNKVKSCGTPWVVIGDLNEVLSPHEKVGGRAYNYSDGRELHLFMEETGGIDLGCTSGFFTWYNKRDEANCILEWLDRAICDTNWCLAFPKVGIVNFPILGSDHAPILLDSMLENESLSFPFCFLEAWCRDPSSKSVVQEAWNVEVRGCNSYKLQKKIQFTKTALRHWNKQYFGRTEERLKLYEDRLKVIQN